MIFEIPGDLSDVGFVRWPEHQLSIENLINAHRDGCHIFAPHPDIAATILKECDLSASQKAVLRTEIQAKSATLMGQVLSIPAVAVVLPPGTKTATRRQNQKITIPLDAFRHRDASARSRIIVEDADTDGAFIKFLAEVMCRPLGYYPSFSFTIVHGGGERTGNRYAEAVQERTPTLCIVDSDRWSPDDGIGGTASGVCAHRGRECLPTVKAVVLGVREIENLLPPTLLMEIFSCNDTLSTIGILSSMSAIPDNKNPYILYHDYKKGLRIKDISGISEAYLRNCLEIAGIPTPTNDNVEGIVIAGVSETLMKTFLRALGRDGGLRRAYLEHVRGTPLWEHVSDVVSQVVSLGACGRSIS